MDPTLMVNLALTAADQIISLIKHIKANSGLTNEQLIAKADTQDLQNSEDIRALLAL